MKLVSIIVLSYCSEDTIVQTGQLWWPVPILTVLGLALFSIGWIRRHSEER